MNEERQKILRSLIYPAIIVSVMWIVKLVEITFSIDLIQYGLIPLNVRGLLGILTSPFLHEGFSHLFGNSVPFFVLGGLLFYFYPELAWRVLVLIYLITGTWVWVFARGTGVHIGASGIVNGLAAFLFLSGILRRETKLMAITLLTTFLYGGLIWGIFPQFFPLKNISWESHLMGLMAGAVLAIYYRKTGPQRVRYDWETEDDDENTDEDDTINKPKDDMSQKSDSTGSSDVIYHYKKDPGPN
jgi:membrane associated rhomboid family serine protease